MLVTAEDSLEVNVFYTEHYVKQRYIQTDRQTDKDRQTCGDVDVKEQEVSYKHSGDTQRISMK